MLRISIDSVERQLKSLNITKASLGVPSKLLHACAEEIAPSLSKLFNMSLELGSFPEKWKDANIVPIQKTKSKVIVPNYRGISLLDVLSKLLERRCMMVYLILFPHIFLNGNTVSCLVSQLYYNYLK
jgi:hypothetical protein